MTTLETRKMDPFLDQEGLIRLYERVFGHEVTPAAWAWKYMPPWTESHYCYIARDRDEVIGYFGAVPLRGTFDGEDVAVFQLADAMVHPDYRMKHDYFELAHQKIREDIIAVHPRHLLYGFSRHKAYLWFVKKRMGNLVEKAITRELLPENAPADRRFEFREMKFTDPEVDRIWERKRGEFRAGLIRDSQYLTWRYGRHPFFGYRLSAVYEGDEAIGLIVTVKGRKKNCAVVDSVLPWDDLQRILQEFAVVQELPVISWIPNWLAKDFPEGKDSGTHFYHFKEHSVADVDYLSRHFFYSMGDVDYW